MPNPTNPLAVLDDDEQLMQMPTLGQIMEQAVQNTQDSLTQTGGMLTDPQALLAGITQPLTDLSDLAGDPQQYFQKQLAGMMTNGLDGKAAQRRRRQRTQQFMNQGQQDYLAAQQAVQIPMGGFIGGPNRGLI